MRSSVRNKSTPGGYVSHKVQDDEPLDEPAQNPTNTVKPIARPIAIEVQATSTKEIRIRNEVTGTTASAENIAKNV
jgi:hypothetical protein